MRVAFPNNLWGDFNPNCNYFTQLLEMKYDIKVVDANDSPDLLFLTGALGRRDKSSYLPKTRKISVNGEHSAYQRFNTNSADLHLSHDPTTGNNLYYPHWLMYIDWWDDTPADYLTCSTSLSKLSEVTSNNGYEKTEFCSYVARHGGFEPKEYRVKFAQELMKYKQIDCPGDSLNNCDWHNTQSRDGSPRPGDKLEFLKPYKFNIAFENRSDYGYVTEKFIHPYTVDSIPLYWGGTKVLEDFNTKSFIYVNDFNEAIDKISEIDSSDQMYADMVNEPLFKDNKVPEIYTPEYILSQIERIL